MSQDGRSEEVTFLRRLIARIEGEGGSSVAAASGRRRLRLGADPSFWLDAALGGGVKRGALYEIAPGGASDQTAACGFALGLAARFAGAHSGALIWIGEDFAWRETGAPYGLGLLAWGLDPDCLVLVRAADAGAALWALEEALKCRACAAVVGEIWNVRRYGEAAARRLVLAARAGGAPCILIHPSAFGGSIRSHGAQARFAVFAAPGQEAGPSLALPGRPRFAIQLLKTKFEDGRAIPLDPDERRLVAWSPQNGLFDEPSSAGRIAAADPSLRAGRVAFRT